MNIISEADHRRSVPLYDDVRTSSFKEEDYGRRVVTGFIKAPRRHRKNPVLVLRSNCLARQGKIL